MKTLHIVTSSSTRGSLQHAIKKGKLSGKVVNPDDSAGMGPLDDGIKRLEFLAGLGYGPAMDTKLILSGNAFRRWGKLLRRLSKSPVKRIFIWVSGSGTDYVFLRMACWWLEAVTNDVYVIRTPTNDGRYHTAEYPPKELVPMQDTMEFMPPSERAKLSREYEAIVQRPEQLRECDATGTLHFRGLDYHDPLVLASCSTTWENAARVVGRAMGDGDPINSLSDSFLSTRLEHLIQQGLVEADEPRDFLRFFNVRLAQSLK